MKVHQAIAEAYKSVEQAFHQGDAEAISQLYTEDAKLLVPETPIISGRQAINGAWKALLGSGGNYPCCTSYRYSRLTRRKESYSFRCQLRWRHSRVVSINRNA